MPDVKGIELAEGHHHAWMRCDATRLAILFTALAANEANKAIHQIIFLAKRFTSIGTVVRDYMRNTHDVEFAECYESLNAMLSATMLLSS